MWRAISLALVLLCAGSYALSQNQGVASTNVSVKLVEVERLLESILESLLGENDDSSVPEETVDYLISLIERPVNLNSVTQDDLERMYILSPFRIDAILSYREEFGPFFTYSEVELIPGFDKEIAERLSPFFKVEEVGNVHFSDIIRPRRLVKGRSQFLLRGATALETKEGYLPISKEDYDKKPDSRYLGSRYHLYGQYKYELDRNLTLVTTFEKDAGEVGLDFFSWSFAVSNIGNLKRAVAGSYTARFGQGVVLWNGFNIDSSVEPFDLSKREQGIAAYSSVDENMAFKGAAGSFELGALSFTIMLSSRQIDARIVEDGYTSLLKTGLHNTVTTVDRRQSLGFDMAAINVSYSGRSLKVGVTASGDRRSQLYAGRDLLLRERAAKFGKNNANIGLDWRYIKGRFLTFGEGAVDIAASKALVAGFLWRGDAFEFSSSTKYYDESYITNLSSVTSVRGDGSVSAKTSLKITAIRNLNLYLNTDIGKNYKRFSFRGGFSFANGSLAELRFASGNGRNSIRGDLKLNQKGLFSLYTRGDLTLSGGKTGWQLHQEFLFNLSSKLNIAARVARFEAEDWNNRIYSYERDILYMFRMTTLYGKGWRGYLNLRYELWQGFDLWLKASATLYSDRETIGEGLETISGPLKSEIRAQLRVKF